MTARPREAMSAAVAEALDQHRLRTAYDARPPYQRNDYLLWIRTAKREGTRARRLQRMLRELRDGATYMDLPWRPWRTGTAA